MMTALYIGFMEVGVDGSTDGMKQVYPKAAATDARLVDSLIFR